MNQITAKLVSACVMPTNANARLRVEKHLKDGDSIIKILHADYRWRKVRNRHIEYVEPFCQMCGYKKKLEVHHIVPWHIDEALRFDMSNLITLDRECHFRFGHFMDWKDSNKNIRELCSSASTFTYLRIRT